MWKLNDTIIGQGVLLSLLVVTLLLGLDYSYRPAERTKYVTVRRKLTFDPKTIQTKRLIPSLTVETPDLLHQRVQDWKDGYAKHLEKADSLRKSIKHDRFFPFEPMASCKSTTLVGQSKKLQNANQQDHAAKIICGLEILQKPPCVIYSIGSNNVWRFEKSLLRETSCEIHTFDCTGPKERFDRIPQGVHFHHVCLAAEPGPPLGCTNKEALCGPRMTIDQIQEQLEHETIDLLKIDIEGWEMPMFRAWTHDLTVLPRQLLAEFHYVTIYKQLAGDDATQMNGGLELQTPRDLVELQAHMLELGYVVAVREDSETCPHCTELTLLRI